MLFYSLDGLGEILLTERQARGRIKVRKHGVRREGKPENERG